MILGQHGIPFLGVLVIALLIACVAFIKCTIDRCRRGNRQRRGIHKCTTKEDSDIVAGNNHSFKLISKNILPKVFLATRLRSTAASEGLNLDHRGVAGQAGTAIPVPYDLSHSSSTPQTTIPLGKVRLKGSRAHQDTRDVTALHGEDNSSQNPFSDHASISSTIPEQPESEVQRYIREIRNLTDQLNALVNAPESSTSSGTRWKREKRVEEIKDMIASRTLASQTMYKPPIPPPPALTEYSHVRTIEDARLPREPRRTDAPTSRDSAETLPPSYTERQSR